MVRIGYFLEPNATDVPGLLDAARTADRLGLDLLGIQDHPYAASQVDTWTLLSAIGSVTERITLFPDVACLPLRPPAVLANAAATLDLLTGGRVELGLGAGGFFEGITAMGGPDWTPGQSVSALEEALDVFAAWFGTDRSVRVDGQFHRVVGARAAPKPAHRIELWIGAYKPRMLRLTGAKADGWLPSLSYLPPEDVPAASSRIDDAALAAGRDPARIQRIYNVWGDKPAAEWIDLLTRWHVELGFDGFVFGGPPTEGFLRTLAEQIAPAVRARVG